MVTGYGQEVAQKEETQVTEQRAGPGNQSAWDNFIPADAASQMRDALFGMPLPRCAEDFENWFNIFPYAIDLVARVPGFDSQMFGELNRDVEDLSDLARAEGFEKICASKMGKFIFKLRSLVPKGDVPIAGMTGITAMITTNSNVKQEVRMPQQQAPTGLFDGVSKMLRRGQ